jgi:hypothetical protein
VQLAAVAAFLVASAGYPLRAASRAGAAHHPDGDPPVGWPPPV